MTPALFQPIDLRGVRLRNRLVVSPMCQYSAVDGAANDWHLVHLGRFALGGFGAVIVEATGVSAEGRISPGDMGLYREEHVAPLARIAAFLKAHGAVPGIQLAHAGRKASTQRPWEGGGPLTEKDLQARGEAPWTTLAPSAEPFQEGWHVPHALDVVEIEALRGQWRQATLRAVEAGFEIVEVHAAHGYLLHEFLSPLSNSRTDEFGGSLENRMRLPLQIVRDVRNLWPQDRPVFVRISATDWVEGGWTIEDSIVFARELKKIGVDVVDCSSAGNSPKADIKVGPLYQVPFAAQVKAEAAISTMAVGLITEAKQANEIVDSGQADLVALAREALADPQFPLNARHALGDPLDYSDWPVQAGPRLEQREKARRRHGN